MDADFLLESLAPWMATWLVHSTALLLGIWCLTRLHRRMLPATEVFLWRAALVGSLVTATLPTILDLGVPTTGLSLPTRPAPRVAVPPAPANPLEPRTGSLPVPTVAPPEAVGATWVSSSLPAAAIPVTPVADHAGAFSIMHALALLWTLGVLWLSFRTLRAGRGFRRRIRPRDRLDNPTLAALVGRLARAAGLSHAPLLTVSEGLHSPVALGILRPEICMPRRAVEGLAPCQQEAMLAHELGHVARRDALWMPLERWLAALLWLQPLVCVARRRIREATELACDAFAVRVTREPLALAECLAEVAGWARGQVHPTPVPAMSGAPSLLARRVDRLLEVGATPRATRRMIPVCGAFLLVAGVALFVPRFRIVHGSATAAEAVGEARVMVPVDRTTSKPAGGALATELAAVDQQLERLAQSLAELRDIADALRTHPEIRTAAGRLDARWNQLMNHRRALAQTVVGARR